MRKLILLCAVASLALAQGKPAAGPSRDAGVAVPPRTASAAPDGGVPQPAGTAAGSSSEIERLRREVSDLKLRSLEAEQRAQTKADALAAQVDKLSRQLDDIKGQLTTVTEAEERRADAELAAQTRRTSTAAASTNLNAVLTNLSSGNTGGIEPSLRYAETVFTGNAQKNVQAARAALANGDVFAARQYLILALIDADAQR